MSGRACWYRVPIGGGVCHVCPSCATAHRDELVEAGAWIVDAVEVFDACEDCGALPETGAPPAPLPGRVGLVADVAIVAGLFAGGLWLPEGLAWVLAVGGVR